jgi:hypothetical protein
MGGTAIKQVLLLFILYSQLVDVQSYNTRA